MTSDLVLVATDDVRQFLDPNGVERTVTLPAATAQRAFRILNIGLYDLRVVDT
ncbi:MAG: hypothetical protein GTN93_26050, partial [Anaerolineae bacterium]|nr:hypothetical protein [Anaerolineae bacterium]